MSHTFAEQDTPNELPGRPDGPKQLDATGNVSLASGVPVRKVVDFIVPGSVGKVPLQCTRSISTYIEKLSAGSPADRNFSTWNFEHFYRIATRAGRFRDVIVTTPSGVRQSYRKFVDNDIFTYKSIESSDRLIWSPPSTTLPVLILDDGTKVYFKKVVKPYPLNSLYAGNEDIFDTYVSNRIVDPNGVEIQIKANSILGPTEITDASGRWIKFKWNDRAIVEASSSAGQKVVFTNKSQKTFDLPVISEVIYSDGSVAKYEYYEDDGTATIGLPKEFVDTRSVNPLPRIKYHYEVLKTPDDYEHSLVRLQVQKVTNGIFDVVLSELIRGNPELQFRTRLGTADFERLPNGATRSIHNHEGEGGQLWELGRIYINANGKEWNYLPFSWEEQKSKFGWLSNNIREIKNPNGYSTLYDYNPINSNIKNITYVNGNEQHSVSYTYTDESNPYYIKTKTDEMGRVTSYDYWENHLLKQVTYPDGTYEQWNNYNIYAQAGSHKLKNGATEYWEYDAMGRLLKYWPPSFEEKKYFTKYTYYSDGHPWEDRVKTETDPNGNITTYEYERYNNVMISDRGLVSRITYADESFKFYQYNHAGKMILEFDNESYKMYDYDFYNRLRYEINALGQKTTWDYTHDEFGPYAYVNEKPAKIIEPSGKTTTFKYDNEFQLISKTVAAGTDEASDYTYKYDGNGNLIEEVDPFLNKIKRTYDYRDKLISKQVFTFNIDNPTQSGLYYRTTIWERDLVGNILEITYPDNTAVTYTYDSMNRKKAFINELGDKTKYDYSKSGKLQVTTDPQGRKTGTYYDAQDRVVLKTNPSEKGQSKLFEANWYDGGGNISRRLNANNIWTEYTYDSRNREINRCYSDETPTVGTSYDMAGRVKTIQNKNKKMSFTYNTANQLKSTTHEVPGEFKQVVNYSYDSDGNRKKLESLPFLDVEYGYNEKNLVSEIKDGGIPVVNYEYREHGKVSMKQLGNGVQQNRYYHFGIPLLGLSEGEVQETRYNYDVRDRITNISDTPFSEKFSYSLNSQLLSAYRIGQYGEINNMYQYDQTGNVVIKNENNSKVLDVDLANQTKTVTGTDVISLEYDKAGNRVMKNNWKYTYDAENKLLSAINGSTSISLKRGPLGYVSEIRNGTAVSFPLYDGLNEILRLAPGGNLEQKVIWGPGINEPISFSTNNEMFYFHLNHLNSVVAITNNAGTILERYLYEPYGSFKIYNSSWEYISHSTINPPVMFTGQRWIPEIGLYDFGARYYDADIGLWTSVDPKREYHSGYNYVGNNPVNAIDPNGLETYLITTSALYYGVRMNDHSALYIENGGDAVIYDPAGSYVPTLEQNGTLLKGYSNSGLIEGDFVDLNAYVDYHFDKGTNGKQVSLTPLGTTAEHERTMVTNLQNEDMQGSSPAPLMCTVSCLGTMKGANIDPGVSLTPGGLKDDVLNGDHK